MALDDYWIRKDGSEFLTEVFGRIESFQASWHFRPNTETIRNSISHYYGSGDDGVSSAVLSAGQRGELQKTYSNIYRYLIRFYLSNILGTKTAYKVRARGDSTDPVARESASLGDFVLAAYVETLNLHEKFQDLAEKGIISTASFIRVDWDEWAGKVYMTDPDTGHDMNEGDVRVQIFDIFDVFYDFSSPKTELDWVVVRDYCNKYELMARYPDMESEIDAISPGVKLDGEWWERRNPHSTDSDFIPLYTFYARPCRAVPEGKMVTFLSPDVWLTSGPLPYDDIPVYAYFPEKGFKGATGYSPALDILGPVDAYNKATNTILTNHNAFGVQNVVSQKGNDITPYELAGGINMIEYAISKPEPLSLLDTKPEIFQGAEMWREIAVQLMGLNDSALGNPDSRTSAQSMAMLTQKVNQYASVAQVALTKIQTTVGLGIINVLRRFAKTDRVAALIGQDRRYMVQSFEASNLDGIERVQCELTDPALRTFEMRASLAEAWVQHPTMQMFNHRDEYFDFLFSGMLPSEVTDAQSAEDLIRRENEMLMRGELPSALKTDNPVQHIRKHMRVLEDPELRNNPDVAGAVFAHVQAHIELWNYLSEFEPDLLAMMGVQPSIMVQQMQAMNRAQVDPMAGEAQVAPSEQALGEQQAMEAEAAPVAA